MITHSVVVGASKESPATGRVADLMQAAHLGAEAAIRLIREGNTSTDVKKAVVAICKEFNVNPIEGMMSHAITKDNLAVDKCIVFKPTEVQSRTLSEITFEAGEVYCIDVAVSLGEGKTLPLPEVSKTTIYGKNDITYALKLKTSRAVFSEIQSKVGSMAFHTRILEDQTKSRMAINECVTHQLLQPYDVQGEKDASVMTARFMFTAAVMPAGPLRFTDHQFNQELVKPEASLKTPELVALLDAPVRPSKKDKKAAATA